MESVYVLALVLTICCPSFSNGQLQQDAGIAFNEPGRDTGSSHRKYTGTKWDLPIKYKIEVDADKHANFTRELQEWQKGTCLSFVEGFNDSEPHIFIEDKNPCSSELGQQDVVIRNIISISGDDCSLIHELGHTLGFTNEEQRPDRDEYVTPYTENVLDEEKHNFDIVPSNNYSLPYDFSSVMHSGWRDYSRFNYNTLRAKNPRNEVFIGSRDSLSYYDRKMVNLAYGCIDQWLVNCSLLADPCLNDGYIGENCTCVCRPGTSGVKCEAEDMPYLDALEDSAEYSVSTSVVTTETQIQSTTEARQVIEIIPPECHDTVLNITSFKLAPRSEFPGGARCRDDYFEIRTSGRIGGSYCGSFYDPSDMVRKGKNFTLYTWLTDRSSYWTANVTFVYTCTSPMTSSTTTETPSLSDKLSYLVMGDCTFRRVGNSFYLENKNYPDKNSGLFRCKLVFRSNTPVTYNMTIEKFYKSNGTFTYLGYWEPKNVFNGINLNNSVDNEQSTGIESAAGKIRILSLSLPGLQRGVAFRIVLTPEDPAINMQSVSANKTVTWERENGMSSESEERWIRAPKGRRILAKATNFDVGGTDGRRICRNALVISRTGTPFYAGWRNVYCQRKRGFPSSGVVSRSNVMGIYNRVLDAAPNGFKLEFSVV